MYILILFYSVVYTATVVCIHLRVECKYVMIKMIVLEKQSNREQENKG